MSEMLGITDTCIKALNTTIPCDQDLFGWTIKVDEVYWTQQDVTTLCIPACINNARTWTKNVKAACHDDWIVVGDRYVPAETLSLRFVEGLEMACLRDKSSKWCLVDSYNWVGSDVVQVDCGRNPADPWCVDRGNVSARNGRISSLYTDDLLCSECFLGMLYRRVTSEFLPDAEHSDYLVEEFQDVQSVCKTTVGPVTTRPLPGYPPLTEAFTAPSSTTTTPRPSPTLPPEEDPGSEPHVPSDCSARAVDVRTASGEGIESCNQLAQRYNVATGYLVYATNSDECYSFDFVCVPAACQLRQVKAGDTCVSISAAVSNATNPVSVAQLATYNPQLMGACDRLTEKQYICITRPGGSWEKPPDDKIPDNSEGPIRGGPGSGSSLPIIDDPSTVPAERVQAGIAAGCTRYIKAAGSEASCWKMANDARISSDRLFQLNPVLGDHGQNCDTQVWLGYYYCISTNVGPAPSSTSSSSSRSATTTGSSSTTTSTSPVPSPQHSGTIASCNKWVKAVSGDFCSKLATTAGIDSSLFYKWNPVLGANGENCGTMIWPDYYYCVGVVSGGSTTTTSRTTSRTTTSTGPPKPTNTHAGTPANCSRFVEAKSGSTCWQLATDSGIELSVFYRLNPVLGTNGENCSTQIWPGYSYCTATR